MNRLTILLIAILIIAVSVKGVEIAYAELPFVAIVKPVDETISSNDVLQDDDDLSFACSAGKVYAIELSIFFTTSANGDYSNGWTLPTGASGVWTRDQLQGSSTSLTLDIENRFDHNAGTGTENFTYRGFIEMGTTSGTCQYQWSQFNTDAGNTTTEAGSSLKVYETTPSTITIPYTTVTKTIDEIVTGSVTQQPDDELFFACRADKDYHFELVIYLGGQGTTEDIETSWTLPSGAVGFVTDNTFRSDIANSMIDITTENFAESGLDPRHLIYNGVINMGSTAGTCNLNWAQAISGGANTSVDAGSTLTVFEEGTTVSSSEAPFTLTHTKVIKAVDETVTNSIVLQDDDELKATLSANKDYSFMAFIFTSAVSITPDIQLAWTIPSGATGDKNPDGTGWDGFSVVDNITTGFDTSLNTSIFVTEIHGRVNMGSTAGDLQLTWSQRTSSADATTVHAGSSLRVWEEGTAVASLIQGLKGDKGDKGDTGSTGAQGQAGSGGSPVSNTVTPDPISESQIVQLVLAELGEQEATFLTPLEIIPQSFFEFAIVDATHNNLVLNSFLSDQRLGIRWSSGQDIAITSAIPSSSPFNITFEQFPVVKQGSGAVISTNFVSYTLQIPDNIEKARYEIPVIIDGIIGGNQVTDTGTITVNLTEDAFDPILLLILAMFGIPLLAVAIQKARGRSATPPVRRIISG